jgi:type 1 glutamine amidotransferase
MRVTIGRRRLLAALAAGGLGTLAAPVHGRARPRRVLMLGGDQRGPLTHDYGGALQLLAGRVRVAGAAVTVIERGWPRSLAGVASVVLFSDGGDHHPVVDEAKRAQLETYVRGGGGLVVVHSALLARGPGGDRLRVWLGGGLDEKRFAAPPIAWLAGFETLPDHPVLAGVQPFSLDDEWFLGLDTTATEGVRPVLTALPPEPARTGETGPARPEVIAWCYQRKDGGRSFAFSGGHYLENWRHPDFVRILANATLWTAQLEPGPAKSPPRKV